MNSRTADGPVREGERVAFSLQSVYLPDLSSFLSNLAQAGEVTGTVIGFSDNGPEPHAYALVSVPGTTLVVPCRDLRRIDQSV